MRPVSKIIIDYVDIDAVGNGVKETKFIKTLQTFLLPNLDEKNGKYLDKLFYLGPLYHWIFPNLKKLIFMDVGKQCLIENRIITLSFMFLQTCLSRQT